VGINGILSGTDALYNEETTTPEAVHQASDVCSAGRGCVMEALEKYNNQLNKNSKKCQICEYERRGTGRYKNVMICLSHGVRACGYARPPRAMEGNNHLITNEKTKEIITDFSWICGDDSGLTCMEKFHVYYLPRNLFKAAPGIAKPPTENQERATGTKLHFARIIQKCELYKARQAALGIESKGRRKKNNKKTKEDKDDSSSSSSEESIENRNTNNKRRKSQQRNNKNKNRKKEKSATKQQKK